MTIIHDMNRTVSAAVRPRQVCDHCGGPFGMVTHRWWGSKFCKRRCKDAYIREIMLDRNTLHRWCGLLTSSLPLQPTSRLAAQTGISSDTI
jgi:hypothetical protein